MGYCISFVLSTFRIPAKNIQAAQNAVGDLYDKMPNDPRAHSGSWHHGSPIGKLSYMWMGGEDFSRNIPLADQIKSWGYDARVMDDGSVIIAGFNQEKIGQEEILWETLAPFVSPGSYIEMRGEDGYTWRWVFDGSTCRESAGKVSFE